ncbi:restriction endonuclease subunit S [Loigolactobacillus backii]|uniref:restriction endonuclease subunit S n=1 Tax=Loigolactobacillus backii TaxID=375175 RepID=UPI0007F16956|nr:restriction endonuclease subunit S [Loigolactobacillus backii]ANK68508.1 type I restriction endonuclease [Loigolactobacillus backii]PIO88549.1 type I restriction endonuclease [Loigolactobacillus backii]
MAKIDDSVKKKVPELRFKGFTDEWEERKLKDIAQFNPKTVLPDEFEYVDLESVVGTEMISHRTESKDQAPSRAQRLAQKGDVFYQTVRPYQMNNYLYDLPYDNYVFSTGYAQMRPNIDSYFLLNSVQNKQFVQHVLDRSTGTSYPAINSSDLSNIEIHVPSKLSEQQKIGAFFQSIDDTIALHQRKLDLLKEQKKGYLQKMFPKNGAKVPESRFAGFADDWEQRKLGAITDSFSGGTPTAGKAEYYGGEIPFIRSGEISSDSTELFITDAGLNNSSAKMVGIGDILYALYGATSGETSISRINGAINQAILAIRPTKGDDPYMIVQWLKKQKETIISTYLQGGQGNLSGSIVKDLLITLPKNKDEQAKVGSFFKQLDQTITLQQRKLDLLKEQKKGFLQKMFV